MRVPSIDGHRTKIEKVCKDNNISFLGLFGSYARHENTEESDIDLLIDFYETKSLLEIAHIQNILSDILQRGHVQRHPNSTVLCLLLRVP